MKITPTSLTIAQLLGSENEQYVIPAYQRRFSWRRHQIQDFWDDLQFLEDADTHLLGTIVCLAGHHAAGINGLELVDGQQRLTTVSILLHCLQERLKTGKKDGSKQDVARLLRAEAVGGDAKPKIVLDSLDAKQFKRHASGDLSEPVENIHMLQAFEFFRERLAQASTRDIDVLLYRLKNQVVVIRLDVSEAKDAFKLFETINNRGLRLSATDIIKNFVLGNAARFGTPSLDLAKDKWGRLLAELDGIPLDTFFRQYMTAHLGTRVTQSEVVEEFQKSFMRDVEEAKTLPERGQYGDPLAEPDGDDEETATGDEGQDDDDDAEKASNVVRVPFAAFLDRLVKRSAVYRQIVLGKTGKPAIDRRLRSLRLIRAQQSYGFLMSLKAGGCTDKEFEEVLRLTEIFLLRRHITRERGNENEAVFARLCATTGDNPTQEVRALYHEYCPNDQKFRQEFAAAVFPSQLMERARYCLEQFEIAKQGTHLELLPGGPDIVHVEHIIPQRIKTKKAKKQFGDWVKYLGKDALNLHPRYVSRIGNLTLFSGDLNIGASNNPYRRKKPAHARSAFKLTQSLPVDYPEFRFEQVDARSEELADTAVAIWPRL